MKISFGLRNSAVLLLLALMAAAGLLAGCLDNLCTKRLYIYRDVEQKSLPPADMALLIADPAIVTALFPEAASKIGQGMPWAPEQPAYASDFYQLSIDGLDGRRVYQGLCLNITPSYVSEVRPGSRQVMASLKLVGPWGQQHVKNSAALTLEPGGVYFLHPDWDGAANKTLRLQAERLPARYDAAGRAKLIEWLRRHTQGRSLEN
ncbi:MAG: hypothetical protein Q7V36_07100 [Deltaproteobacteria bacterium]|nr:hypothetical protein [Deltaproteobacteria bacterium]